MPIKPEHLDELLAGYEKPEDLLGEDGLFKQLKKALIERALGAELTDHLGYEKGDPAGRGSGNSRNGPSAKTVLTEDGEIEIEVPRDRDGSFEPQMIAKGQTPLRRLRRQDHLALRPGHDGAGDPGPPARALRHRRLARPDQPGHRRRPGRGRGNGRTGRSIRSIRWSSSTPCGSRSATRAWSRTRPSMSRWRSTADGDKDVLGLWIEQSEGAKFWLGS